MPSPDSLMALAVLSIRFHLSLWGKRLIYANVCTLKAITHTDIMQYIFSCFNKPTYISLTFVSEFRFLIAPWTMLDTSQV